jgi:hypothetical protein
MEPILVVDVGTATTMARVVADRGDRIVKDPQPRESAAEYWPTSVARDARGGFHVGAVAGRVGNARRWSRGEIDGVSVPADRRKSLLERFTGCGVVLACHLIRAGVDDPAELRTQLCQYSGLTKFRQTLVDHFGERADLIKLDRLIERTRDLCDDQRITLTAVQGDILDEATSLITGLRSAQPAFNERAALRAHYERRLALDEQQTREMLRLFGESPGGRSIADRLGLPGASPRQLAEHALARSVYWREQIDLGAPGETREACRTLSSSYNHLRLLLTGG